MASFRLGTLLLAAWGLDLLLLSLFPLLRLLIDPLLLFLIFQGSRFPARRFLWLQGVGVGLLRDLSAGSLFGMWACTFALVGWSFKAVRHMVEWEDPLIVGVLAFLLTFAAGILHPLLLLLSDPAAGGRLPWLPIFAMAAAHGVAAYLGFPFLRRFVQRSTAAFY